MALFLAVRRHGNKAEVVRSQNSKQSSPRHSPNLDKHAFKTNNSPLIVAIAVNKL